MPRGDQDVVRPPRGCLPRLAMTWAVVIEIAVLVAVLLVVARLYIGAVAVAVLVGGLSIPVNGPPPVRRSADA